jgi:hypothetical protein
MYYGKECVENYDYWHQPHEIEAHEQEETLYVAYFRDKGIVPLDELVQWFPNRLMQTV